MSSTKDSQQKDNGGSVVSLEEALWRLRLTPVAAELHDLLPPGALLAADRVDLSRCVVSAEVI